MNEFKTHKKETVLFPHSPELEKFITEVIEERKQKIHIIILMAAHSTSETGHAINLDHYKLLYDTNVGFGTGYNPSNIDIKLPAMHLIWVNADAAETALNNAVGASKTPTAVRQDYWKDKSKLITRVYNEVKSSGVSELILKDSKALADKFRGVHHDHPLPPPTPTNPTPESISTSHMSYVMRTDTLQQIIALLTPVVKYAPNQTDLTLAALTLIHTAMKNMNDNYATNVLNPVNTALIARNNLFYGEGGMLDNAQLSKDASKAHFGATAPQTHTVTVIAFRRP